MLEATELCRLLLGSVSPGEPAFISAASGLVRSGGQLYVIADDELHLGVFAEDGSAGARRRLLPGTLPEAPAGRKAQKPDFESLLLLPAFEGVPHGALLALGSGSTPRRRRAALLRLDPLGRPADGDAEVLDFSPLFLELEAGIRDVNIEGAVVAGNSLWLMQRGNGRELENAVVEVALEPFLRALAQGGPPRDGVVGMRRHDLGLLDGVPLSFTDAAALEDGRVLFSAVGEDTRDPYEDGPCAGSVLGIIERDGRISFQARISLPVKVEGIAVRDDGHGGMEVLMVADADDPAVPAPLLRTVVFG